VSALETQARRSLTYPLRLQRLSIRREEPCFPASSAWLIESTVSAWAERGRSPCVPAFPRTSEQAKHVSWRRQAQHLQGTHTAASSTAPRRCLAAGFCPPASFLHSLLLLLCVELDGRQVSLSVSSRPQACDQGHVSFCRPRMP